MKRQWRKKDYGKLADKQLIPDYRARTYATPRKLIEIFGIKRCDECGVLVPTEQVECECCLAAILPITV
jgi:hypothetical protein